MYKTSPINVKSVLQIHPHVDGGWFWSKYSAQPYVGCSYGCTYCFLRGNNYGLSNRNEEFKEGDQFSQFIQYKKNAPKLLDFELSSVPKDVIVIGDYQPIESKLMLSRKMLEICLKHRFPVLIIVKSLLVLRDIDLLEEMTKKSWVGVVFSITSSHSAGYREIFEPGASSVESRFSALKQICSKNIYSGVSLMPIMPKINDSRQNLEEIVKKTVDCGGKFVIGGGLTLLPGQKKLFYSSVEKYDRNLLTDYEKLYDKFANPKDNSWIKVGNLIRELCLESKIDYRIKRFIPESLLKVNKFISTELFLKVYEMELGEIDNKKIWQWRKSAWEIDELTKPIMETNLFNLKHSTKEIIEFINRIRKKISFS